MTLVFIMQVCNSTCQRIGRMVGMRVDHRAAISEAATVDNDNLLSGLHTQHTHGVARFIGRKHRIVGNIGGKELYHGLQG